MISLAAVALTSSAGRVDFGVQAGRYQSREVKLVNESPYALLISIGADQHWLGAWTADVFPTFCATTFSYTPSLLTGDPAGVNYLNSNLLVTVALGEEKIPGVYPASLTRAVSQPGSPIATHSVAGNAVDDTFNFTVPAGTQAIAVKVINPVGQTGYYFSVLALKGHTTAAVFYQQRPTLEQQQFWIWPVVTADEASFDIVVTSAVAFAVSISITAILTPLAVIPVQTGPGQATLTRPKGWDAAGWSSPGGGITPSIVFAAITGIAYQLDFAKWQFEDLSAAATASIETKVLDGASTTIQGGHTMVTATNGSVDRDISTDEKLLGTVGNSMTVNFATVAAGYAASCAAGVFENVPAGVLIL